MERICGISSVLGRGVVVEVLALHFEPLCEGLGAGDRGVCRMYCGVVVGVFNMWVYLLSSRRTTLPAILK